MKYLIYIPLLLIFIIACSSQQPTPQKEPKLINDEACEAEGGYWNECGSLCAGNPPNTVCPAVCNPQCECGGIVGYRCPEGFKCKLYGGIADEMGVCVPA